MQSKAMSRTHYEVLGLRQGCSPNDIRSAYRKLVLKYHPDRSSEPHAADIFIAVTESYDVLNDPGRRREYDRLLATERLREAQARSAPPPSSAPRPQPTQVHVPRTTAPAATRGPQRSAGLAADLTKLSVLFSRGQYGEAEKLARRVRAGNPRQPLPYAVLADIARSRGDMKEAAKLYAFAIQMDPTNEHYRLRYEELLRTERVGPSAKKNEAKNVEVVASLVGVGVVLLACIYIALSQEPAVMPSLSLIDTWTLGLVVMTFLSGVVIGASLSIGRHLDRFQASVMTTLGKISPNLALATVAIVNFWVAAAIYVVLGLTQRGFNYTTSRLVGSVATATCLMTFAASFSHGSLGTVGIDPLQVLIWGGNLMYVGALAGWMVADSLRR
jgi:hypothetical protein